jgi:hypothetical protein
LFTLLQGCHIALVIYPQVDFSNETKVESGWDEDEVAGAEEDFWS